MKTAALFSLILSLGMSQMAQAISADGTAIASGQIVSAGELMRSPDGKGVAIVNAKGQLELSNPDFGTKQWPTSNVASFGVDNVGRLVLYSSTGTVLATTGTTRATGTYYMRLEDNGSLGIYNVNPTSTSTPLWTTTTEVYNPVTYAIPAITGTAYASFTPTATSGTNTKIYVLDSGDSSSKLFTETARVAFSQCANYKLFGDPSDYKNHGTRITSIIKSPNYGLAPAATVVNVKITIRRTNEFSEKNFVTAMKYVDTDAVAAAVTKIVNFSGYFGTKGNSNIANCAIQWAYYKNIYVFQAAGNSNANVATTNPYEIVVGSATQSTTPASVTSFSNFGNNIDIWGPADFISPLEYGTSISTAFATATMATWISRVSTLSKNPALGYPYLKAVASTTILPTTDAKVVASPNAGNKFLSIRTASPTVTALAEPSVDYCNLAKAGLSKKTPDWDTLISLSSTTIVGRIVRGGGDPGVPDPLF